MCVKSNKQESYKRANDAASGLSILLATASVNPIVVAACGDSMQTVAYLKLANKRNSAGFDDFLDGPSYFHSTNLIQIPPSAVPQRKREGDNGYIVNDNTASRILQTTTDTDQTV